MLQRDLPLDQEDRIALTIAILIAFGKMATVQVREKFDVGNARYARGEAHFDIR